jgi:hypothetical protein
MPLEAFASQRRSAFAPVAIHGGKVKETALPMGGHEVVF